MSTTILTDTAKEAVDDAIATALGDVYDCNRVWDAWSYGTMGPDDFSLVAEDSDRLREITDAAIQAILQSPEVQAWKRDAEAFRLMVSFRFTVKVDEVCSDVEVFHLGECLAWPPAHHCENDEEVATVAREAIQKAVATLKEQS